MLENYEDGTTASLAFLPNDPEGMPVRNKYIFTAVIGDSPIIIRSGENIWRSPEHNVRSNPAEREAAENRGGYVHSGYLFSSTSGHGQGLQMSRALGDKFLRGIISTEAETAAVQVQEDGYIIVATDGVFDPGHAQGATDDFFKNLHDTANAQSLVDYAVNELKTGDNATAILARF
jgi:serine/threonine protein phosphatase PrpC